MQIAAQQYPKLSAKANLLVFINSEQKLEPAISAV